jgi:hypothetical protein
MKYQTRAPKVRMFIGEVEVPIVAVTYYHTINMLPYVEAQVLLDNKPSADGVASIGGVEINVKTIGVLAKVLQEKFYNSFDLEPDVTIIAADDNVPGQINPNTMRGFLANPGVMVRNGQFLLAFTVLHPMVRLQAFNPQLYGGMVNATDSYATNDDYIARHFSNSGSQDSKAYSSDPHMKRDNSISDRIYVAITSLVDEYTQHWASVTNPVKTTPSMPVFTAPQPTLLEGGSSALSAFAGITPQVPGPTLKQAAVDRAIAAANLKNQQEQSKIKIDRNLYEPAQWNMHALNVRLLPTLQQVLKDSTPLTIIDNLANKDGTANVNFSEQPLHETIMAALTSSPDALSALLQLTKPFMFQLNATWDDKIWLEHMQTMEIPQSMLVVPFDSLTFNLASQFEIPVLQVIVRGPGSDYWMVGSMMASPASSAAPMYPMLTEPSAADLTQLYNQSGRTLVRYPDVVATREDGSPVPGRYVYVDAPYWISPDFQNLDPSSLQNNPSGTDALNKSVDNTTDYQKKFAAMAKARTGFMRYIAEYTFKDIMLSRTTVRCRIPLFLKPQVGRPYFIKAMGHESSFLIAYLQSVTHTIRMDNESAGADTELVFSHVRARNADIVPVGLAFQSDGIAEKDAKDITDYWELVLTEMEKRGITYQQYSAPEMLAAQQVKEDAVAANERNWFGSTVGPTSVDGLLAQYVQDVQPSVLLPMQGPNPQETLAPISDEVTPSVVTATATPWRPVSLADTKVSQ